MELTISKAELESAFRGGGKSNNSLRPGDSLDVDSTLAAKREFQMQRRITVSGLAPSIALLKQAEESVEANKTLEETDKKLMKIMDVKENDGKNLAIMEEEEEIDLDRVSPSAEKNAPSFKALTLEGKQQQQLSERDINNAMSDKGIDKRGTEHKPKVAIPRFISFTACLRIEFRLRRPCLSLDNIMLSWCPF